MFLRILFQQIKFPPRLQPWFLPDWLCLEYLGRRSRKRRAGGGAGEEGGGGGGAKGEGLVVAGSIPCKQQ